MRSESIARKALAMATKPVNQRSTFGNSLGSVATSARPDRIRLPPNALRAETAKIQRKHPYHGYL